MKVEIADRENSGAVSFVARGEFALYACSAAAETGTWGFSQ
jgi:hypothetical protein